MLRNREVRYVAVGIFNTVIGYALVVSLFYALSARFNTVTIGIIANFLAITVSFANYKLFVFRTSGRWLQEYLRSYVVYGSMALLSVLILWVLVDRLGIGIWIAQGAAMLLTVALSYIGHSQFTFGRPKQ